MSSVANRKLDDLTDGSLVRQTKSFEMQSRNQKERLMAPMVDGLPISGMATGVILPMRYKRW